MKKWIIVSAVVLCVVIAIQPFAYQNCLRLNPASVDRIELFFRTERHTGGCIVYVTKHHVKLTAEEIWKFAMLYNLSSPTGTYTEEPPIEYTRIEIYYKTGTAMVLYVDLDEHFLLQPGNYEITGEHLHDYLQEIIEKYSETQQ